MEVGRTVPNFIDLGQTSQIHKGSENLFKGVLEVDGLSDVLPLFNRALPTYCIINYLSKLSKSL